MAESEGSNIPKETEEVEERDIRYLTYVLVIVIAGGVLLGAYSFFFSKNLFFLIVAIFIGLILGVIAAYYYYASFSAEDRELILGPDEQVLLETSKQAFVSIPSMQGGFLSNTPPLKVNLFLTNKGVIAEPLDVQEFDEEGRLYYFHINHSDIRRIAHESNFMSNYIRLTYRGPNTQEQDILIFAGTDTSKWVDELTKLLGMEAV